MTSQPTNEVQLESEPKPVQDNYLNIPKIRDVGYTRSEELTLTQLLGESTKMQVINIDVSTPAGKRINIISGVKQHFTNTINSFYKGIRDLYINGTYDIEVTLDVNSHFQQVGLLALLEQPRTPYHEDFPYVWDMFEYPHQLITLGHSGTYKWIFRYVSEEQFNGNAYRDLQLYVLEAMKVAAGVEPIATIAVYMRLININLMAHRRNDAIDVMK